MAVSFTAVVAKNESTIWNLLLSITLCFSMTGQQQRVSIARAAYSRPDIVLLDDPLSALDAGTSKTIFENLRTLLSGSAIILVTHAAHFLSQVDKIVLVSSGSVQFTGTWTELIDYTPKDNKTRAAVDHIRLAVQEDEKKSTPDAPNGELSTHKNMPGGEMTGRASTLLSNKKIMTAEEREHGLSSFSTWLLWFKHAGGIPFILAHIFFMTIDRFAYVAVEYFLARWSEGASQAITIFGIEFAPQTDGREAQSKYALVYALLIVASVVGTFFRSEWVGKLMCMYAFVCALLSTSIHSISCCRCCCCVVNMQ